MNKYILDSNIFDFILDNGIDYNDFIGKTNTSIVQFSELSNTKDSIKKEKLLNIYKNLKAIKTPVRIYLWDDEQLWDDDSIWMDELSDTVRRLIGNCKKGNAYRDALIGENAKDNNFTLVTNDIDFTKRAIKEGIRVIKPEQFILEYK